MAESDPKKASNKPKWWHIPNHKRAQPYSQSINIHIPSPTAGGGPVTGGKITKY